MRAKAIQRLFIELDTSPSPDRCRNLAQPAGSNAIRRPNRGRRFCWTYPASDPAPFRRRSRLRVQHVGHRVYRPPWLFDLSGFGQLLCCLAGLILYNCSETAIVHVMQFGRTDGDTSTTGHQSALRQLRTDGIGTGSPATRVFSFDRLRSGPSSSPSEPRKFRLRLAGKGVALVFQD